MIPVEPTPPDFHFCNPFYALNLAGPVHISYSDCEQAELMMPRGVAPIRYYELFNEAGLQDLTLPLVYTHGQLLRAFGALAVLTYSLPLPGTCQISITQVDPKVGQRGDDGWFDVVPDQFREMAGWVIEQCMNDLRPDGGRDSSGGFVTRNISNAIDYLRSPGASLNPDTYRMKHGRPFFYLEACTDQMFHISSQARDLLHCHSRRRAGRWKCTL